MTDRETMKAFARAFAAESLLQEFFDAELRKVADGDVSDAILRRNEGRRGLAREVLTAVDRVKKGDF